MFRDLRRRLKRAFSRGDLEGFWEPHMEVTAQYRNILRPEEDIVHAFVRVVLTGFKPPDPTEVPRHYCGVIDTSESMKDDAKLERAKAAARVFVNQMGPRQYFSFIGFNTTAQPLHPAQGAFVLGDEHEKRLALIAIDGLKPAHVTSFLAGLQAAYKQCCATPAVEFYVLLLSDGLNNTDLPEFGRFMEELREYRRRGGIPFQVSCRRFGRGRPGERVPHLRLISDVTGGDGVRVISDLSDLEATTAQWLDSVRCKCVGNLRLLLRLAPGAQLLDLKQVTPTITPLKDVIFSADDGTHTVTMGPWDNSPLEFLVTFRVPSGPLSSGPMNLGGVSVLYNNRGEQLQAPDEGEVPIIVGWSKDEGLLFDELADVSLAVDRVECAHLIDAGLDAFSRHDFGVAQSHLGRAAQLAHQHGDQGTLNDISAVCQIIDPAQGSVSIRSAQQVEGGTMYLDATSTSSPLGSRTSKDGSGTHREPNDADQSMC